MNHINGIIPPEIANLTLEKLDLNHNNLVGPIYPEFGMMSRLFYLDFSSNHLSGNIYFQKPCNFQHLDLSTNLMSEDVTGLISACYYLEYLDISGNNLSGQMLNISNFPNLVFLDQSHNHLIAIVPGHSLRNKLVLYLATLIPTIVGGGFLVLVNLGKLCIVYHTGKDTKEYK